jgi:LytR cell envelope-related transcriptional attenuator
VRKNGAMADRGAQTGGTSGGRSWGIPDGVRGQSIKGAALIVIAIVVGLVLLQIVDPGKSGPVASGATTTTAKRTTPTTSPHKKTTPTTAKAKAIIPPAQLHLIVLNAGAPSGSAGHVSTTLKNHGYTNQGTPGNDPTSRVGTEVFCKAGLTREASALVTWLGSGTTKGPLVAPQPAGTTGYQCVVLVGSG